MNTSWMMIGIAFWFLARWKIDAARWARRYQRLANEQNALGGMTGKREEGELPRGATARGLHTLDNSLDADDNS